MLAVDPALRVLVVDDEDQVCELIADALEAEGFEPLCADTDRDAYVALGAPTSCKALVVDINLGSGTTGYDVARYARRVRPDIPVVYVSGQSTPVEFTAHGVPGSVFVQKPFQPDELAEKVRELVGAD